MPVVSSSDSTYVQCWQSQASTYCLLSSPHLGAVTPLTAMYVQYVYTVYTYIQFTCTVKKEYSYSAKVFLKAFLLCPLFTDCCAIFLFINNMKILTHLGLQFTSSQTFSKNSVSHVPVLAEATETFTLQILLYSEMIPQFESILKDVSKMCINHISPLGQQETYLFSLLDFRLCILCGIIIRYQEQV